MKFAFMAIIAVFCAPFARAANAAIMATPNGTAVAALSGNVSPNASNYITPTSFNQMAPFMTNHARERLQPAGTARATDTTSVWTRNIRTANVTPASDFAKGKSDSAQFAANRARPAMQSQGSQSTTQQRRVVARAGTNTARSATPGTLVSSSTARSAAPQAHSGGQRSDQRRVVARSARGENANFHQYQQANITGHDGRRFSAEQCLADYSRCMDGYCKRENASYNRCYCSQRLAQIDAAYQPVIRDALNRLAVLENGGAEFPNGGMTDEELEEFWGETFAGAGWGNTMASLNATFAELEATNMESRIRGQNAFATGHDYCMQHIQGCFYAAQNLRNVYRSEIAKDCAAYENHLNLMKRLADSAISKLSEM